MPLVPAWAADNPGERTLLVPDVIVIGDGPGGLSAALFLAKNGKDVVVFGQDKTAMHWAMLHNYLGIPQVHGSEFQRIARQQVIDHGGRIEDQRVESVRALNEGEVAPMSATALLGNMKLLVPMKGNIDLAAEKARLNRQRQKLDAELTKSRQKLKNANFVNNAPAAVVTMETERAAEFSRQLEQLDEQLARLDAVG